MRTLCDERKLTNLTTRAHAGACNIQSCWLKLPPFREVATKLRDSLDQAIQVIMWSHHPMHKNRLIGSSVPFTTLVASTNLASSSSSSAANSSPNAIRKSNKKRSSSMPSTSGGALGRSTTSRAYSPAATMGQAAPARADSPAYTASIIGSRRTRGAKRHASAATSDNSNVNNGGGGASKDKGGLGGSFANDMGADADGRKPNINEHTNSQLRTASRITATGDGSHGLANVTAAERHIETPIKKRPFARSIGMETRPVTPSKTDLLYYETSPDFCSPNPDFDVKGTKGRICSENADAENSCQKLCCGRGHKTEKREEKYKCECQFKYCCILDCKICTRRTSIHKCS